jgi:hypothetical protein
VRTLQQRILVADALRKPDPTVDLKGDDSMQPINSFVATGPRGGG